ncbi:MAG: GNAT family N-acetyltransferase [Calditrichia bacterium]
MPYQKTIAHINKQIEKTESALSNWNCEPEELKSYRPQNGGWTINEILEHISLTSFFLLKIIRKHVERAEKRAVAGQTIQNAESDLQKLKPVGIRGTSSWIRPEHMEPSGSADMNVVYETIREQFAECRSFLERMNNGCGSLATVNMSVGNLGKMDMYQWIYFLTLHAWRHHIQIKEINEEYVTEQMTLTEVSGNDIATLQKISIDTFRETYEQHNEATEIEVHIKKRFSKSALLDEIQNSESQFFLACFDATPIGYLKLNWGSSQTEQQLKAALEIERIYVVNAFHGKGIGKVLFQKSVDIAKARGFRQLWLGVWEKNPRAIRFYEKSGLKVFDTHFFVLGEEKQKDYLMKMDL